MLKKIVVSSIIFLLLPVSSVTSTFASTVETGESQELGIEQTVTTQENKELVENLAEEAIAEKNQTKATTTPVKNVRNLMATKLDSDIVLSSDLGNQAWLINEVKRQIPAKTIDNNLTFGDLKTITTISLNYVGLSGGIPSGIKYFSNLVKFHAYGNSLSGEIPVELGSLKKLKTLSIRNNKLTGTIPKELSNMTGIRSEFNLASNQLTGEIPEEIGNMTWVTGAINLSSNKLTGRIPASFSKLTNMNNLQLQNTQLTGVFPMELMQSARLTILDVSNTQLVSPTLIPAKGNFAQTISNNQLVISANPTIYNTTNDNTFRPFDNESLTNSGFKLINKQAQGAEVPLYSTHTVQILDHANNEIVYNGPIDSSVSLDLTADTNRFTIYLDGVTQNSAGYGDVTVISNVVHEADFDNQAWLIDEIKRQLPGKTMGSTLTFEDLEQITTIQLTATTTGYIPTGIAYLSGLTNLSLVNMGLTGEIPASIGDLTNLTSLTISKNALTGPIPESIGNLKVLTFLSFYDNQISGNIPSSIEGMTRLQHLLLHGNELSGEIPEEIGQLKFLETIYLEDNQLSGQIPSSLGTIATLASLNLSSNRLIGIVPTELTNLDTLNLSNNQVTFDSSIQPTPMTNSDSQQRYADTFIKNSQLAGSMPVLIEDGIVKPFDETANTYFNLHYTDDGTTQKELYSTHTVTIKNLSTNQIMYKGIMDPSVSFTQEKSTTYRVILDNASENPHNTADITINQTKLSFGSPPDMLDFGEHSISNNTELYQRMDSDWSITVNDNRSAKQSWRLTAKLAEPMKSADGHILSEGLVYKDEKGVESPLTEDEFMVYEQHPDGSIPDITTITWRQDEGILLKVKAGEAYAQEYSGQVEWSLSDAP